MLALNGRTELIGDAVVVGAADAKPFMDEAGLAVFVKFYVGRALAASVAIYSDMMMVLVFNESRSVSFSFRPWPWSRWSRRCGPRGGFGGGICWSGSCGRCRRSCFSGLVSIFGNEACLGLLGSFRTLLVLFNLLHLCLAHETGLKKSLLKCCCHCGGGC